jgi:DNA/RNA-binding domain of Phe-tRNA-synthetase-like protein
MQSKISPQLGEKVPNFKAGVIHYRDITIGASPQMIKGRLQLFQESLYFDLLEKELSEFPGITEWRKVLKQAGTDPSRYRHSAEALYRRVKKSNYLQSVNSAIDLNNFFSLQYEIPFGIYDADAIQGNIELTVGDSADAYTGLNGRENNLENMIIVKDEISPFGSPYVDSERTKVTEAAKNALHIIYFRPSMGIDEAESLADAVRKMFTQVHGGSSEYSLVTI